MGVFYNSIGLNERLLSFQIRTVVTHRSCTGEPQEIRTQLRMWTEDNVAKDIGKILIRECAVKHKK